MEGGKDGLVLHVAVGQDGGGELVDATGEVVEMGIWGEGGKGLDGVKELFGGGANGFVEKEKMVRGKGWGNGGGHCWANRDVEDGWEGQGLVHVELGEGGTMAVERK